jgi:hypothetical protein
MHSKIKDKTSTNKQLNNEHENQINWRKLKDDETQKRVIR